MLFRSAPEPVPPNTGETAVAPNRETSLPDRGSAPLSFFSSTAPSFSTSRTLARPAAFRSATDWNALSKYRGMLLDRMSLSARNSWYDDTGRVYIYYSVDEICGDMTCGRDKAMKLLAELDTKKGIGLIERIKQGQGKPTKIYVKRFTTRTVPPKPAPPPPEPFAPISEVDFPDLQKSEIPTSRGRKTRLPEVEKPDPNHTKRNQTELIQTDPSILPRRPPAAGLKMERYERREELKENIDYERLRREHPCDDIDDLLELMLDVVCSTAPTIRISGSDVPTEAVKDRFFQLDSGHIQ